jgi:iron-regulated transporter 1
MFKFKGILIVFNVISNLASTGSKIAIEKDWVVVIAKNLHKKAINKMNNDVEETDEEKRIFKKKLASVNATIRRIDLTTAIISPLVAGLIMSFFNLSSFFSGIMLSALFFAIWNIISFIFEYSLLASVYNLVPELTKTQIDIKIKEVSNRNTLSLLNPFKKIYDGWSLYVNQGLVLLPSIAFSFLFLTVLSFDSITIGYAKSQQITETFISILQGLGSICGVLGTVAFPLLHNRLKIRLPYVGIIGSLYQFTFLVVCVVAVWLPGSPFILADNFFSTNINKCLENETISFINNTISEMHANSTLHLTSFERVFVETPCRVYTSIIVLMLGMAVSRFGLWLTDLTINQIIQESVDEKERGTIGGVQSSLNRLFDLIKYISVVFLPDIKQYGYLVIISASSIFVAICLYMIYVCLFVRKHRYDQVPTSVPMIDKSTIKIYRGGDSANSANNVVSVEMADLKNDANDDDDDRDSFDE